MANNFINYAAIGKAKRIQLSKTEKELNTKEKTTNNSQLDEPIITEDTKLKNVEIEYISPSSGIITSVPRSEFIEISHIGKIAIKYGEFINQNTTMSKMV